MRAKHFRIKGSKIYIKKKKKEKIEGFFSLLRLQYRAVITSSIMLAPGLMSVLPATREENDDQIFQKIPIYKRGKILSSQKDENYVAGSLWKVLRFCTQHWENKSHRQEGCLEVIS